jgi:hypothetical protein
VAAPLPYRNVRHWLQSVPNMHLVKAPWATAVLESTLTVRDGTAKLSKAGSSRVTNSPSPARRSSAWCHWKLSCACPLPFGCCDATHTTMRLSCLTDPAPAPVTNGIEHCWNGRHAWVAEAADTRAHEDSDERQSCIDSRLHPDARRITQGR